MMNSSCVSGCLEAQAPIKVSFVKLYQWPQADAEFVKLIAQNKASFAGKRRENGSHESFACRQKYLRSYTFSKKESLRERTKKWFLERKEMMREIRVFEVIFDCLFSCIARVDVIEYR
ncbi:hypothetical protein AMTRI_Chr13g92170 [Amborella trichopoda]